jgi:hypothetical protein
MGCSVEIVSEQNEQVIREYFEGRPDWTATKLDVGKEKAADFRICHDGVCFLCEVKTVFSVHASVPYSPAADYLVERRNSRRAKIEEFIEANPDKSLILRKDEREFLYSEEKEFRRKFGRRAKNTEAPFRVFGDAMRDYFAASSISNLSYRIRLDSDSLWIPPDRDGFFKWLEGEVQAIHDGQPSWWWTRGTQPFLCYSAVYPVDRSGDDPWTRINLAVMPSFGGEGLEVELHCYGTLNLDVITESVRDGVLQLKCSAQRESDPEIARFIALCFARSIGLDWELLDNHIDWLLGENPDLSAIAVMDWVPEEEPPPETEGNVLALMEFLTKTTHVPRFIVYHNPQPHGVKPLPTSVFDDGRSLQLPHT